MKKIIVVLVAAVAATFLWARPSGEQKRLELENRRLAAIAKDLGDRIAAAEQDMKASLKRASPVRRQLRAIQEALSESTGDEPTAQLGPDPERNGGWPEGTDYLYFPKSHLSDANYKLLAGDRLTEEAARLFGLTSQEEEAVNRAFGRLLSRFGQLELESMEPIDMPISWSGDGFLKPESHLIYRIPGLQDAMRQERMAFSQQMETILGPSRAALMEEASDAYLRQHVDDLGTGERIVGFLWDLNSDGSHSIWYAMAGDLYGPGSFSRISETYNPDSQMAYYARLFGVNLPSGDE